MKTVLKPIGIAFLLALCFVAATIWFFRSKQHRLFSRFSDERVELGQNVIPLDVRKWVGSATPPPPLKTAPRSLRVPILMYHYVEYVKDKGDTIRQSLDTTPYTLEQQILTLKNAGYTFLTQKDIARAFEGDMDMPQLPILLTFDDGYRDFYTDAFPILKKYDVRATMYLIAGWTGYPNNMTESQIKEIVASGLVEPAAHTVHHVWLKGIDAKSLDYEVAESKKMLESLTGQPIVSFAYPYGAFDVAAIEAVHRAGFTSAVATVPGIDQAQMHKYFLYRLRPGGRTGDELLQWLSHLQNEKIVLTR